MTTETEKRPCPSAPASDTPTTQAGKSAPSNTDKLADVVARLKLPDAPPEGLTTENDVSEQRRHNMFEDFFRSVGRRYRHCTLDSFRVTCPRQAEVVEALRTYRENMASEILAGTSIVLHGASGTGKDHLLIALGGSAIVRHGYSVSWRNGLDLFGLIRDRIASEQPEGELLRDLERPQILILADPVPPSGSLTAFQAAMLLRIIDRRYRHQKPTWLSVNVTSGAEADQRLGPAIVDRLRHDALVCYCDWPSHRRPRNVGQPTEEVQR